MFSIRPDISDSRILLIIIMYYYYNYYYYYYTSLITILSLHLNKILYRIAVLIQLVYLHVRVEILNVQFLFTRQNGEVSFSVPRLLSLIGFHARSFELPRDHFNPLRFNSRPIIVPRVDNYAFFVLFELLFFFFLFFFHRLTATCREEHYRHN